MDPVYFPLLAAGITGVLNVVALAIAVLVYRHNHRSQGNPLKVEMFKKQWDVFAAFHARLLQLVEIHDSHVLTLAVEAGTEDDLQRKEAVLKLADLTKELHAELRVMMFQATTAIFPEVERCTDIAVRVMGLALGPVAEWNEKGGPLRTEFSHAVLEFALKAKELLRVDELAKGYGAIAAFSRSESELHQQKVGEMLRDINRLRRQAGK